MTTRAVLVEEKSKQIKKNIASYFGMNVQVIAKMENYSLILYRDRKSIVCTSDLLNLEPLKYAA
jgi:hypothetical protein